MVIEVSDRLRQKTPRKYFTFTFTFRYKQAICSNRILEKLFVILVNVDIPYAGVQLHFKSHIRRRAGPLPQLLLSDEQATFCTEKRN